MTRLRISDRGVERLRQANPIADVVSEHGVNLGDAGAVQHLAARAGLELTCEVAS